MKNLFNLFLYFSLSISYKAQFNPHSPGSVVFHPELNNFVGTWRWGLGTEPNL